VQAALYVGSLAAVSTAPFTSWTCFTPNLAGQTVTGSLFYGPNTPIFDSSLGAGNVRVVRSYKFSNNAHPKNDHALMYEGPVTGCPNASTSCWTQIDPTSLLKGDQQLANAIAHSTMGNLVVGNWNASAIGHAFIYDISAKTFVDMNPTHSLSITAYGIWQNSDGTYTIAGGSSDIHLGGIDEGYLVDYDPSNKLHPFSHLTKYHYNHQPTTSLVSHFDGITISPTGYNLTGEYLSKKGGIGGFFATVDRLPDGSLGPATWTDISFSYPGIKVVKLTTGNTVIDNSVLGVFNGVVVGKGRMTLAYIATVP